MNQSTKWIVGNDFHIPYEDNNAVKIFLETIKEEKPDVVVLNGDVMDCYSISRFLIDRRKPKFVEELDKTKAFLSKVRKVAGRARIIYTCGNHELRLGKYIRSRAAELEGIEALEIPCLLGLKDLNIEWVDYMVPLKVTKDFIIVHGAVVRKNSGQSGLEEMRRHNRSGLSGHVHRAGIAYHTTDKERVWIENGCMCQLTPEYMPGVPDWQQAFTILEVTKNVVEYELVII